MAVDLNRQYSRGLIMECTVELSKLRPKQGFKLFKLEGFRGTWFLENRGVFFRVGNLRCSHGLFSTLQPAESFAKRAENVGEDAESDAVSKRGNLNTMWKKTREEKTTDWQGGGMTAVKAAKRGRTHADSQCWGVNCYSVMNACTTFLWYS